MNKIHIHGNYLLLCDQKIDINRKFIDSKSYMYDAKTNDRIIVNDKHRNLYIVKGKTTQLIMLYKEDYRIVTIDSDKLKSVINHDWIYKNDNAGGGAYCTKLKMYMHYYLYDPDKAYRKLIHYDGDRLNNTKYNITLINDEILPVGVYYNKSSQSYVAKYIYGSNKWVETSFSVNKYGVEIARKRAIEARLEYENYYIGIGMPEVIGKEKKTEKDNDGWM